MFHLAACFFFPLFTLVGCDDGCGLAIHQVQLQFLTLEVAATDDEHLDHEL